MGDEVTDGLIKVSSLELVVSAAPLVLVCIASYVLDLGLVQSIVVSSVRTFVQLSVVGWVLVSLFTIGEKVWWVVLLYVLFMITLASWEAASRPKYNFRNQFGYVYCAILMNVSLVSLLTFGVILQPEPVWDPQYVIPICGMLLGNCISGISLSLNQMSTSLVEQQSEIELFLCFGATKYEATRRLLREAIRSGTMPTLNSMAVIGLISIPGMMTGQILGGSKPQDAANYQMLIMYLIATCSFGTILFIMYVVLSVGFDGDHRLRSSVFMKREKPKPMTPWERVKDYAYRTFCFCCYFYSTYISAPRTGYEPLGSQKSSSSLTGYGTDPEQNSPINAVTVETLNRSSLLGPLVEVKGIQRSVPLSLYKRRILLRDFSVVLRKGEIATVTGPSGSGKSQFLRAICGLVPIDEGDILLNGKSFKDFADIPQWRKRIRYVTQYKIDMPGTPKDFIKAICELKVNQSGIEAASFQDIVSRTRDYLISWGMSKDSLQKDWGQLSGGEAQRVIVALAMATRPQVILLDESTSALDHATKIKVEKSIEEFARKYSVTAIWITHDPDQVARLRKELAKS